jgi:hypothetical protein
MLAKLFGIKANALFNRPEDVPFWREITSFEPSTGAVATKHRFIRK